MPSVKPLARRVARRSGALHPSARDGHGYLKALGQRIRALRAQRGMTRKMLAAHSGVSERFLAEVESGSGNPSILLLRQLADALHVSPELLVTESVASDVEFLHAIQVLRSLSPEEFRQAQQWLGERFRGPNAENRSGRIALLGLRGAGKSTVGAMLAKQMDCAFLELDRLIEAASGVPLGAIFDLYGQSGFRRFERRCLEEVLAQTPRFVLAVGGSLVSEAATFQRLLASCHTVWLRAEPEDHMRRVLAQGDTRPMAKNPEAMSDLKRILLEREPLYRKTDFAVDTSGQSPRSIVSSIVKRLAETEPA